jgi:hypothetical protein
MSPHLPGIAGHRGLLLRVALLGLLAASAVLVPPSTSAGAKEPRAGDVPLFAYYYIWFNPTS